MYGTVSSHKFGKEIIPGGTHMLKYTGMYGLVLHKKSLDVDPILIEVDPISRKCPPPQKKH